MLSKKNRLRRADFSVRRAWNTYRDKILTLRVSKTEGPNKTSVIIPKSVVKSAVERHSIKRLIYICVEKHPVNKMSGFVFVFRLTTLPTSHFAEQIRMSSRKLINEAHCMLRKYGMFQTFISEPLYNALVFITGID